MATWKYGPVETTNDCNGYLDPIKEIWSVEYHTVSDTLSILLDGKVYAIFDYESSKAVGKMIAQWYMGYECRDFDILKKRLEDENG